MCFCMWGEWHTPSAVGGKVCRYEKKRKDVHVVAKAEKIAIKTMRTATAEDRRSWL